jgi:hypothetical protein
MAEERGDKHKKDGNKPMWDLLPMEQVGKIVGVLTFGAKKYSKDGWKAVPDAKNRYFAAMMRHIVAHQGGEKVDQESGLSHLSHAACCLTFLMWLEDNDAPLVDGDIGYDAYIKHLKRINK